MQDDLTLLPNLRRTREVLGHSSEGPPEGLRPLDALHQLKDNPIAHSMGFDFLGVRGELKLLREPDYLAISTPEDFGDGSAEKRV